MNVLSQDMVLPNDYIFRVKGGFGMEYLELIFKIIMCHVVGDYFLQGDFIAKTKGENIYHLLVHCLLYSLPFYLAFGFDWRIGVIIGTHIIVDALKARWHKIGYVADQCCHYAVALLIYLL